jgi:ribosome-associated heat shock protein Hsp15
VKCTPRCLFWKPILALSYRHDSLALLLPARIVNAQDAPATTVRLDLWLWAARFYKTRALAKQMIESGKVEVGGQRAKPSRTVRVGDALHVVRGQEAFEIVVAGVSDQRGPASVAQALYTESEESKARRIEALAAARTARAGYTPPESKPDKRARRLIRALGDIDAS